MASTEEVTKDSARKFVESAPADVLANWEHCKCEGCAYCDEVVRLKNAKADAKP